LLFKLPKNSPDSLVQKETILVIPPFPGEKERIVTFDICIQPQEGQGFNYNFKLFFLITLVSKKIEKTLKL
jgi:hypothetical protein